MQVKMLKSDKGAPEGHTVFTYVEGEVYELPTSLAEAFISNGSAAPCKGDASIKIAEKDTTTNLPRDTKALAGGKEEKALNKKEAKADKKAGK